MSVVNSIDIDIQLKKIESLYSEALLNSANDQLAPEFYAKLYIIEICGWIEETADLILLNYLDRHKINTKYNESYIKKNYSFDYDSFKKMNINILGVKNFSKIEANIQKKLDRAKTFPNFEEFKDSLRSLKKQRDTLAHTQTIGYTKNITAPSFILPHFYKVSKALKVFENEVSKL